MDEGERYQRAPRRNSGRGVAYWTDGKEERIVTISPGFHLVALNAKTGVPVPGFGQNGVVDLMTQLDLDYKGDPIGRIGNSSPPVIANDVVIVGPALQPGGRTNKENVKGDVMAFDVRSGKKLWVFHTIPRKGEPGFETWLGGADITGMRASGVPSLWIPNLDMCTSTSKMQPTMRMAGAVPATISIPVRWFASM
jgi:quinoprotein glucose dehydrogenase